MATSKPRKVAESAPVPVPQTAWAAFVQALIAKAHGFYAVAIAPSLDLRTLLLVALAGALLVGDVVATKSFRLPLGLVFAVLAFQHWERKTVAPYLDEAAMVAKAEEDPLAASIVFAAAKARQVAVMLVVVLVAIR